MFKENSNVVQSYASICLRKLFLDRDNSDGHDEAHANLFMAVQKSEYKLYIMRYIYQVLSVFEISDKVGVFYSIYVPFPWLSMNQRI